ncbi:hypothetical protein H0H93_005518 [Arthromyces matolae]|nr:hypothetical protein H0H93_005518 [Arthromyces matolae]
MPPKKQPQASSSKVKDDKTFGLKNKNKSAKVQKQVAQLQAQAAMKGKSKDSLDKEKEKALREKAKADEEKRRKEDAALTKPIITQKVPFGVDPKTVLCAYFKAGFCEKGSKCKFSHDPNVGRKVEKKNLYEDSREEKLAGFVLKSQKKALDEAAKANQISLEEFLEVERHKLGPNLTPVTPETFAIWKKTRMDKKEAETEALRKAKDAQNAAGKNVGMSGRDLFTYNPEWFEDEEEDGGDDWDLDKYRREKQAEDEQAEEQRIAALSLEDEGNVDNGNEGQ